MTSDNVEMRRSDAQMRAEIERLRAENRRLWAAIEKQAIAAPQPHPYAAHEMTAGTCVGPRRRRASEPHAPRGAANR